MAWNLQPSHEEVAFLMEAGIVCRDARRFSQAAEIFTGVRSLVPKSEVPDVALGTVRFAEGDLEKAIRYYRSALSIHPGSALAHAHLGEAYLFGKKPAEARTHLKRAIELDPRGKIGDMARGLTQYLDQLDK